jgi:hypothetical protein
MSVVRGRYWRNSRLVFSFDPRSEWRLHLMRWPIPPAVSCHHRARKTYAVAAARDFNTTSSFTPSSSWITNQVVPGDASSNQRTQDHGWLAT